MAFSLPALPYAFDALEPHIDARTMQIHHGKHHQAYIDKANAALAGTDFATWPVEKVCQSIDHLPENIRGVIRNNAGGHANHSLFWTIMGPNSGGEPTGDLAEAMQRDVGDFAKFKEALTAAGVGRFGSGWAWLSVTPQKKLVVESTPNQDSPLMAGNTPILGVDVWEHAYYLNYQNRRPDYLAAFFNVVNWTEVARRYKEAIA